MSRSAAVLSGGMAMFFQAAVRIVAVVVVSRILSRASGGEMLGAYSVVWQLIGFLQILELGFSQAIGRELAQQWHRGGDESVRRLARTGFASLSVLGVVLALALAVAAWSVPAWLHATDEVVRSTRAALVVAALWMPLRFPLSFFFILLFARQKLARYGALGAAGEILRAGLTIAAVWAGWGLVGVMLAWVVSELATYAASAYTLRGELTAATFVGRPSLAQLRALVAVGLPLGLMSLGDRLTLSSQDLIVGSLAGAAAASGFYATRMPGFLAASVLWQLTNAVSPGLNDLYGRELHDAFRRAHLRLVTYAVGAGLWAAAGICAFTADVVGLWLGPRFFAGYGLTAAVALLTVVAMYNNICNHFNVVLGRLRFYTYLVLGEGVLAVVLAFVWGRAWGVAGVMWAAVLAHSVSVVYFARLSTRLVGMGALDYAWRTGTGALRCAAVGVSACALYAALPRLGLSLHPLAGVVAAFLLGAAGFVRFGLFPEDRRLVHAAFRRVVLRRVAEQHV